MKNKLIYQANIEIRILSHLRENDYDDNYNIARILNSLEFRDHVCIVFELLSINLYDFLKLNDFDGVSMSLIRRFAIQILYALNYLKGESIVHWDLKPENIVLKNKYKSGLKIIDFGSSTFINERVYTYIQSRFYRAPEIMFGIPYGYPIDMWSFGCVLAELFSGYPLFPGENEKEQIGYIMEIWGVPEIELLEQGQRSHLFFNPDGSPIIYKNTRGKKRLPNTKTLKKVIGCDSKLFLDFLKRWFIWDPEKRMSPEQALRHEWILEGIPPAILVHHQKLHNISYEELPRNIQVKLDKFNLKGK